VIQGKKSCFVTACANYVWFSGLASLVGIAEREQIEDWGEQGTNIHISLTLHYFRCVALQTEIKTPQLKFMSVFVLGMRELNKRERERNGTERKI